MKNAFHRETHYVPAQDNEVFFEYSHRTANAMDCCYLRKRTPMLANMLASL